MRAGARPRALRTRGAQRAEPINLKFVHTQSFRLATGQEVLVSRVLTERNRAGFGFSFQLDGTEARHMALYHAGLQQQRPQITPVIAHPWETAYVAGEPVPWDAEPEFARLQWLSA